jgi:predicted dehydrogenase
MNYGDASWSILDRQAGRDNVGFMARPSASNSKSKLSLAVLGMGNRGCHMSRLMCEADPDIRIAAVVDTEPPQQVRERMRLWKVPGFDEIEILNNADDLLKRADDLDGIVIATPCHLHAAMTIKAIATGLPLFIEKPVAISWEQVEALRSACAAGREDSIVVSFPLRLTIHVQTAMEIIRSGRLGVINQVQAVNNVPYGGVYFGQWYRSYEKTGGLWLQKATHDFDYITHMLGSRPTMITAMHSRLAYGGSMPPELHCSGCDLTDTCPESPQNLAARGDDGGTLNGIPFSAKSDHACTFSSSIQHQDAGSAIVMYESGAHVSYAQNFLSRRSAGQRGATVIGYDATLAFSWQNEKLRVIDHHRDRIDEISVKATGGHGGGDQQLASNFADVVHGRAASRSPLNEGLLSAAMCLSARESAASGVVQRIPSFDGIELDAPVNPGDDRRKGSAPIEPPESAVLSPHGQGE